MNFDPSLDLTRRLENDAMDPWDEALNYVERYREGNLPRKWAAGNPNHGQQRELQDRVFASIFQSCVFHVRKLFTYSIVRQFDGI